MLASILFSFVLSNELSELLKYELIHVSNVRLAKKKKKARIE